MLSSASQTLLALHRVAGSPLRAWLGREANHIALSLAIEQVRERATQRTTRILAPVGYAGASMDYATAVAWALAAAERLSQTTHYDEETGVMIKDETGASGSTHSMIDAYLTHDATSPSPVHAAGIAVLRVHSGTQLDRAEWEAAYTAIQQKYAADGHAPLPPDRVPTVFRRDASVASGLKDGTKYSFDGKKLNMRLQLGGEKTSARTLLQKGGVPDSAWSFYVGKGEVAKRWIAIDPAYAAMAADALAAEYPMLAAAIRQNEPSWVATAGVTRKVKGAATASLDTVPWTPEGGANGTAWAWRWLTEPRALAWGRPPAGLLLAGRFSIKQLMAAIGYEKGKQFAWVDAGRAPDLAWPMNAEGKAWWCAIPANQVADFVDRAARAGLDPTLTDHLRRAMAHHGATDAAPPERTAADEGRWTVRGDGAIKLYTSRNKAAYDAWWTKPLGLSTAKDGEGYYHLVRPAQVNIVATAMEPYWPLLAEAFREAFAHIPQEEPVPQGEDGMRSPYGPIRACAPLAALCRATDSAEVHDATALAMIAEVKRALTQRLPVHVAPHPHQLLVPAFGRLNGYRMMVGDGMGSGKTKSTLSCIAADAELLLPAVVVAPSSVILNWGREARDWLPNVPIHPLLKGGLSLPPKGWKGIVLVTWTLLEKYVDALSEMGIQFFVGDELHYIKNPDTARSRAARRLAQITPHASFLSGTPLLNRRSELWHPLACLDAATWGNAKAFERHFMQWVDTGSGYGKYEGEKNTEELKARLSCVMIARTTDQLLKYLPEKTRKFFPITLQPEAMKAYRRIETNFREFVTGKVEEKKAAMVDMAIAMGKTPEEAVAIAERNFAGSVGKSLANARLTMMGYLRQSIGLLKVPAALAMAEEVLDNDQPVVLFAEFRATVRALREGFAAMRVGAKNAAPRVIVIDGDLGTAQKDAAWNDFQNGRYDVVIGSASMREGINLFRARNGIFVERWWVPALEAQAEARLHRLGQKNAVTIWYPVVPKSIDEHMEALAAKKRGILATIMGAEKVTVEEEEERAAETAGDALAAYFRGQKSEMAEQPYAKNPRSTASPVDSGRSLPPANILHALLFSREAWSAAAAAHWTKMHGLPAAPVERKSSYYQVTCRESDAFRPGTFRTVRVSATVTALVAQPGRG